MPKGIWRKVRFVLAQLLRRGGYRTPICYQGKWYAVGCRHPVSFWFYHGWCISCQLEESLNRRACRKRTDNGFVNHAATHLRPAARRGMTHCAQPSTHASPRERLTKRRPDSRVSHLRRKSSLKTYSIPAEV